MPAEPWRSSVGSFSDRSDRSSGRGGSCGADGALGVQRLRPRLGPSRAAWPGRAGAGQRRADAGPAGGAGGHARPAAPVGQGRRGLRQIVPGERPAGLPLTFGRFRSGIAAATWSSSRAWAARR